VPDKSPAFDIEELGDGTWVCTVETQYGNVVCAFHPERLKGELTKLSARLPPDDLAPMIGQLATEHFKNYIITSLYHAVSELVSRSIVQAIRDLKAGGSITVNLTDTELLHLVSKHYQDEDKRLWSAPKHGGARKRKGGSLDTEDELKQFARITNEVQPTWVSILKFVKEQGYASDALEALKVKTFFKELNKKYPVPTKLLVEIFKRETSGEKEFSPQGFAFKHAYRFMRPNGKLPGYSTLRRKYNEGKDMLKAEVKTPK
jgi:hypothetical protein